MAIGMVAGDGGGERLLLAGRMARALLVFFAGASAGSWFSESRGSASGAVAMGGVHYSAPFLSAGQYAANAVPADTDGSDSSCAIGEFSAVSPFWDTPYTHVVGSCSMANRHVLVSYAGGPAKYAQFQLDNCRKALLFGVQECFLFNRSSLPPQYEANNKHILDVTLGAGLWSWKAISIFMALQMLAAGDTVLYMDSGSFLIGDAAPLFRAAESGNDVMIFADCLWSVEQYSQREALVLLDGDKFIDRYMPLAAWSLWHKGPDAELFLARWLTYSQDRRVLYSEGFAGCSLPQHPKFRGHRHDMVPLIISAYHANISLFRDPSQYGVGKECHERYPNSEFYGQLVKEM